jgi:hypothetical protein
MICAHAPTEEKKVEYKETCEKLDQIYHRAPAHDTKTIIGDLNAKIGQEEMFRPTIGEWSLHDISNDNGLRAIDFATSNNIIIKSTYIFHIKIYKRQRGDLQVGLPKSQIDRVMIDGRHALCIIYMRSCRGADCDTDHFLVRIKYRQRISNYRRISGATKGNYDVGKLKDEKNIKEI